VVSAPDSRTRRRAAKEKRKDSRAYYMISVVARRFEVHPQTLRLYEREGLVKPSRTQGNTRLYSEDDLERLSFILNLTRDLGVNLAGVEIIMNLRQKLESMQGEMERFIARVQEEFSQRRRDSGMETSGALVRVSHSGRNTKTDKG